MSPKPIGILYEHPEWFKPLFAEMDRRGLPYEPIPAHEHSFDPSECEAPYSLVVNRVSPSSYLRGHARAILYAAAYMDHLQGLGVPVVNGLEAYALEVSKAKQLSLMSRLGLPHPRSRAASAPDQLVQAARELEFPVIVKPNVGGSGALMRKCDTLHELRDLEPLFEIDGTAIVQEYHPPKDGAIVRIEVLDGRFLYAIRITNDPNQGFNLCPADICQVPGAEPASEFEFCAVTPARPVQATQPPEWTIRAVMRIFEAAHIDVGGAEYLESERDGQIYLYDINALSNFVADAPRVVGFDPFVTFVDYVERRAGVGTLAR